jgi:tetratricopeptide (TPR) repeat protein
MRKPLILARHLIVPALILLAGSFGTPSGVLAADVEARPGPESLMAEGQAALGRGDLPAAARAYRLAAEASDDEAVAEQASQVAFENYQYSDALGSAERWLKINPSSEQAERFAGVSALALHRIDVAESHFKTLVDTAYVSPAAGYMALLPVIMGEATAPDVTELFRRLSAQHPKVAEGQDALGNAALQSSNYALALQSAQEAVRLAPYWIPAKLLLARATIASGREDEGLAMARDLALAPDADVATHMEYALVLASTGHDQEARAILTPYATGNTVVPAAVRTLGMLDLQNDDLKGANGRFEELLTMGSQSYEALYYLGVIAERRNDEAGATRYYSRVTGGDQAIAAQQRVAYFKAKKDGVDAGLAYLEQFGRSQPSLGPQVVMARAGLLSSMDDDKRALAVLDAGLAQYPEVLDLRLARVFAYERMGKTDASVRELREILDDRPGDPMVQNALGYTLADQDRDLVEARALVTAALAQTPDSAAVLDSMGWVLYREKNYAQALEYLQRAHERDDDAEISLHLGEVQWAQGDEAAARKTWAEALERHPGNKPLEKRIARAGK